MSANYCTVAQLKGRLWPSSATPDSLDDDKLNSIIAAVSRTIDAYTNRRFHTTVSDETRYYTALDAWTIFPDDIISVTTFKTDGDGDRTYEDVWDTGDYDLKPYNASQKGEPYTEVTVSPDGDFAFPVRMPRGVEVVGKFGYASQAPPGIVEACLLQCERLYKRSDAIFGVVGSGEMGQLQVIPTLDPDVKLLLQKFVKLYY